MSRDPDAQPEPTGRRSTITVMRPKGEHAQPFHRGTYDDGASDRSSESGLARRVADAMGSGLAPQQASVESFYARAGPARRRERQTTSEGDEEVISLPHTPSSSTSVVTTWEVPSPLIKTFQRWPRPTALPPVDNVGVYLATRLAQVGIDRYFAVPGDYNLLLLDQFLKHPQLHMIRCCNELNAGYAADGYCRVKGVGCVVVTFTVGGLSVINAIAGSYSDDMPVIVISGGPNTNDFSTNRVLHHTLGKTGDFSQQVRMFKEVTCHVEVIQQAEDAMLQIDRALVAAFINKKPVYIEVCCNLSAQGLNARRTPIDLSPLEFGQEFARSNEAAIRAAVDRTAAALNGAVKPVIVAGVHIRDVRSLADPEPRNLKENPRDALSPPGPNAPAVSSPPTGSGLAYGCHVPSPPHMVPVCACSCSSASGSSWTSSRPPCAPGKALGTGRENQSSPPPCYARPHPYGRGACHELVPSATRPLPRARGVTVHVRLILLWDISWQGYAVAVMPNAKGMFPESHEHFMGTYWGQVSSPCCCEIIESADVYLFVGPLFNDYTTVGYSLLLRPEKMVQVSRRRVKILGEAEYGGINMARFLTMLKELLKPNDASYRNFSRMRDGLASPAPPPPLGGAEGPPFLSYLVGDPDARLSTIVLFKHIQAMLTPDMNLVVETGDAWFHGQKLRLPDGCRYEFQMQYGSIGWSVGAVLGMCAAQGSDRRTVGVIGDGSFQMTAQEVSTMIEQGFAPIIFLLNNRGYTIEVEIHDGPYNDIKNWDYAGLVQAFRCGEGDAFSTRVDTEGELLAAIRAASGPHASKLCLIEATLDRDDCSTQLLEWGARVADANGRPPVHH